MLCAILDDVWSSLEPRFSGRARICAPLTIANALLDRTLAGQRDPAALKAFAEVRALAALDHPEPAGRSG
jgi:hypothetical protein